METLCHNNYLHDFAHNCVLDKHLFFSLEWVRCWLPVWVLHGWSRAGEPALWVPTHRTSAHHQWRWPTTTLNDIQVKKKQKTDVQWTSAGLNRCLLNLRTHKWTFIPFKISTMQLLWWVPADWCLQWVHPYPPVRGTSLPGQSHLSLEPGHAR